MTTEPENSYMQPQEVEIFDVLEQLFISIDTSIKEVKDNQKTTNKRIASLFETRTTADGTVLGPSLVTREVFESETTKLREVYAEVNSRLSALEATTKSMEAKITVLVQTVNNLNSQTVALVDEGLRTPVTSKQESTATSTSDLKLEVPTVGSTSPTISSENGRNDSNSKAAVNTGAQKNTTREITSSPIDPSRVHISDSSDTDFKSLICKNIKNSSAFKNYNASNKNAIIELLGKYDKKQSLNSDEEKAARLLLAVLLLSKVQDDKSRPLYIIQPGKNSRFFSTQKNKNLFTKRAIEWGFDKTEFNDGDLQNLFAALSKRKQTVWASWISKDPYPESIYDFATQQNSEPNFLTNKAIQ